MPAFQLESPFTPTGDQPTAIQQLVTGIQANQSSQTLLGVTGSGKTFTMANVIAQTQRPTLVISHNKTLAAQLASEFREFFPHNAVHYFVSFYDYYQPESYIPRTDTYIEKTTELNQEIERMRHAATEALLSRRDVIIVASVSCIYGLGSPEVYKSFSATVRVGEKIDRRKFLAQLVEMQYARNDMDFFRGNFRVKGEIIELFPAMSEYSAYRFRLFGDEIERIEEFHALSGELINTTTEVTVYPATHYVAPLENRQLILEEIAADLQKEVAALQTAGKELEAHRLKQRTSYDIEMLRETGYVNGIENYSRYFDRRRSGEPPYTLLHYFPKDFLLFIDESHMTIPQIAGMYRGDQARKQTLIDYGFRLQAARDNRPLRFEEFEQLIHQVVYVSATPKPFELEQSWQVVQQLIRPTGLLDPEISVRPTADQIPNLIAEIEQRTERGERVLITTLTKRMAEELTEFLRDRQIAVQYLHSEVNTLDRLEIIRDLRLGMYDVLVGINLLREGIDLPEVSLVVILDADKEGFLRSSTALIQTIGRAARHEHGQVIMYADHMTGAMKQAIAETDRRRAIQADYNKKHGITPRGVKRELRADRLSGMKMENEPAADLSQVRFSQLSKAERQWLIDDLEQQMKIAAENLRYEQAAALRDEIAAVRRAKP